MGQYALRRAVLVIPTVFLVIMIVFSLLRLMPDAVQGLIDSGAVTPAQATNMREYLGLNKPVLVQFKDYLGTLARFDLGYSVTRTGQKTSTVELFRRALPVTFELGVLAIIVGLLIAVPIGVMSALKQDTWMDYLGRSIAIGAVAIPNFWIATLVIIYPAIWWGYSPPFLYTPLTSDPVTNIRQFIVPAFILGLALSGGTMRLTRNLLLEVLRQDYIRTAMAKGLNQRTMIIRHALKNALIPVVTHLGAQLSILIGGAAIIETIFNLPGMGSVLVQAANGRDYPVVQSGVLMLSIFIVTMNLLVDLAYGWLDPRIHYQ